MARRFYLPPGSLQGKRMIFEGKEARHIVRVLRLKRGEKIIAFDGCGNEYAGIIGILSPRRVEAILTEILARPPDRAYRLALAPALLKGQGLDAVIRQATELGVSDFYPVITARSVARLSRRPAARKERWAEIAAAAARQSGQSRLPEIHLPLEWKSLLNLGREFDLRFIPYEDERERTLKTALKPFSPSSPPSAILVLVGPEGGFTAAEVKEASEAGFVPVRLGPSTLRSATAGLAAVACIHYHFDPG